jgi:hypothetical protein
LRATRQLCGLKAKDILGNARIQRFQGAQDFLRHFQHGAHMVFLNGTNSYAALGIKQRPQLIMQCSVSLKHLAAHGLKQRY